MLYMLSFSLSLSRARATIKRRSITFIIAVYKKSMKASSSSGASSLPKSIAVNIISALPPGTTKPLKVALPFNNLSSE